MGFFDRQKEREEIEDNLTKKYGKPGSPNRVIFETNLRKAFMKAIGKLNLFGKHDERDNDKDNE